MESIWKTREVKNNKGQPFPKSVEAAGIGGGMAGILCAWLLREAGVKAVVFEAAFVGSGQTKNTTAKITSQHGLYLEKLIRTVGPQAADQYVRASQAAIDEYERIIEKEQISCGFKRLPAYLYTNETVGMARLEREKAAARAFGIPASMVYDTELPMPVTAALRFDNQAQFRPLDFLYALAEQVPVFEGVKVFRVRGHELLTNRGTVTAKNIIFATHYPFPYWPGFYFARMHQERSRVLALKVPVRNVFSGMYYGIDSGGLSLRSVGDTLLLGGEASRTGEKCDREPFDALRRQAEKYFSEYEEEAFWAAEDCMTLDGIPYIGKFSIFRPDWYVATGFGKWGMTNSMAAAMAIRDMITGKDTGKWQVFSPQRINFRASIGPFLKNTAKSAKNLLTPGGPRCTHLGCKLVYNRSERSWDCPCHGSRYTDQGKLIDNPARKNVKSLREK